jgi:hypothetical protein
VDCAEPSHPHKIAHTASGRTDDGVHWSLFWWDTRAVIETPDEPASRPTTEVAR